MEISKIIAPIVHNNGTHIDDLLNGLLETKQAIDKAIESLRVNFPHCRDYYLQDNYSLAREQQEKRIRLLNELCNDLEIELELIADQRK